MKPSACRRAPKLPCDRDYGILCRKSYSISVLKVPLFHYLFSSWVDMSFWPLDAQSTSPFINSENLHKITISPPKYRCLSLSQFHQPVWRANCDRDGVGGKGVVVDVLQVNFRPPRSTTVRRSGYEEFLFSCGEPI